MLTRDDLARELILMFPDMPAGEVQGVLDQCEETSNCVVAIAKGNVLRYMTILECVRKSAQRKLKDEINEQA